ncbi:MAG TPA: hypothetical protein VHR66_10700 [Gemmataceae bacterium]|nr:hypothetical protein [Gemmataceae bacterium]
MAAVFSRLRQLQDGWDSYGAPAPSEKAIANAFTLVTEAINHGLAVDRAEPSAMGGVGITFSEGMREVVVEFYNADTAHALFSDDAADDARTAAVPTDGAGYKWIIDEVQKHLDGN